MARFSADKRLLVYGLTESYADIFCFSTTRHGGCSTGEYASFNCNHYCGDSPQAVMRNREQLCSLMPRPDALVIPHQTHGTTVRVIDENFVSLPDKEKLSCLESVDALVTNVAGQCLCVSTADCVPVLCYDARRRAVAAIHAGWRGTVARIVEHTLRLMADVYGTDGRDVHACIGPSISPEAFEVGDEVWQAFRDSGFPMGRIAHRCGKWHIDLWEANRLPAAYVPKTSSFPVSAHTAATKISFPPAAREYIRGGFSRAFCCVLFSVSLWNNDTGAFHRAVA